MEHSAGGDPPGRWRHLPFLRITPAAQGWVSAAVAAALVVPLALDHEVGHGHTRLDPLALGVILAMSVLNIEIGRLLEGGAADGQRPHKSLSTWSFACALVLSIGWLLPVVVVSYAHARWRGMRVPLWKWVGSAAYVVLAGVAAAAAAQAVLADQATLVQGDGLRGLVAVLAAAGAFLVVETVLFHGSAYLNSADDEQWLRQILAQPSFYVTELGVLLVGGLAAAVWTAGAWFLALLLPVFVLAQRAVLHEPLRERADHDDKTGLLRFGSWHRLALNAASRCHHRREPWSVLFVDLDHFKQFNDAWGHLAGDLALVAVAETLRGEVRKDDLLARFGGEEFCVFLPHADADEALGIAERIRVAVSTRELPGGQRLTASVGVSSAGPSAGATDVDVALLAADRALYDAKRGGRDRTCTRPAAPPEGQESPAGSTDPDTRSRPAR